MRLVSWNVNGLRACVTKGFADTFRALDAYIFCLQETTLQPRQVERDLPGLPSVLVQRREKGLLRHRRVHEGRAARRAV